MAQDGTILHCLCDEGDSAWALSSDDVCYDYAWVRRTGVAYCCCLPDEVLMKDGAKSTTASGSQGFSSTLRYLC